MLQDTTIEAGASVGRTERARGQVNQKPVQRIYMVEPVLLKPTSEGTDVWHIEDPVDLHDAIIDWQDEDSGDFHWFAVGWLDVCQGRVIDDRLYDEPRLVDYYDPALHWAIWVAPSEFMLVTPPEDELQDLLQKHEPQRRGQRVPLDQGVLDILAGKIKGVTSSGLEFYIRSTKSHGEWGIEWLPEPETRPARWRLRWPFPEYIADPFTGRPLSLDDTDAWRWLHIRGRVVRVPKGAPMETHRTPGDLALEVFYAGAKARVGAFRATWHPADSDSSHSARRTGNGVTPQPSNPDNKVDREAHYPN